MERLINDLAPTPVHVAELEGELIITNGFNQPRFANARSGLSGVVGFNEWSDPAYIPTFNSATTGALDNTKYYAIRLVPISTYTIAFGSFLRGRPTDNETPQTGATGILWDIVQNPDTVTFNTGVDTAGTPSEATDSTKEWAVDQWIGYECLNVSTGITATITANSATVLTLDADLSLLIDDDFSILGPRATSYAVYAAEVASAGDIGAAAWYLQYFIDYGVTTYDLVSFVQGEVMVEEEYFQPPNTAWCVNAYNRIFYGGGVTESRGKASAAGTTITGNTSGADQTYLEEGLVGAYIQFAGDTNSYLVSEVDRVAQTLEISETYVGFASADTEFQIVSDYNVWWSDVRNAHIVRTESSSSLADRSNTAVESGGYLLIFCDNSIWKLALQNLGQLPTKVSDTVQCRAPFSVVKTPRGIFFWDGEGISVTDGQSVNRVTQYKAQDYLAGVNRELTHNIRGVYNAREKRVEFYFTYGTDVTNNYGLHISVDSLNCYGTSRLDCNAVWADLDDEGRSKVYHGTTGRHTSTGVGDIWEHDNELPTDGDVSTEAFMFKVMAVDTGTRTIEVESFEGATLAEEGWSFLYLPVTGGNQRQMMIKSITETNDAPYTYDVVVSDDFQVDDIIVDDLVFMGGIPLTYGPVWTDFQSAVYQHHVRGLQVDTNGFEGVMMVDHYVDAKDGLIIETSTIYTSPDTTHITVPFRGGSAKSYGFRIRIIAQTEAKIYSVERLFDTEV